MGGATLVTYRYLSNKFLKPLHEKMREESERIREEGREKGHEEGRKEGRKEGREEERFLWAAWNQRRLEAEQGGEPFDEPPPGSNDNGKQAREE